MKRFISVLAFCFSLLDLFAQRPSPDQLQAGKGTITIQPILHGSLVLTWDNKTIYVDPYGGAKAFRGLAAPDMILITDIHQDHLSLETLKSFVTTNAVFIVPQAVMDKLPSDLQSKAIVMSNGMNIVQKGIAISAIPMYNLPETSDSKHTKGRGNGYMLDLGGKSIYISGDTEDIKEMRALKDIDVAFICMNLPYTMDIEQAASAVLEFKPKIVYPYHYRGQDAMSDTEAFKKLVNAVNSEIEVRLRNWYPVY
jgi:L-ascorbate metabolism protein UlaG (beta-lactamase superfamily)